MKKRMKMKDLERRAGVSRETVRFYIREGLLPEPERTGRNMAWYDESFVERIRLIKELQRRRFLPLQVIKAIVAADEPLSRDEARTLLDLDGKVLPVPDAGQEERLSDVSRRTGLAAAEIRELADVGVLEIVVREGDSWLEPPAIRLATLWARLRQDGYAEALGFSPASLRPHVELVRWLAREELRVFLRGVTGKVDAETSARMAESGIRYVNEMLGQMRESLLLRYIAEGRLDGGENRSRDAEGA